ncbi:MAG TPA: sporulation initiation factor Spo0A C-terminal domain-containing protein [Candidatus Coprovivens excrementavium]|nr:sporulation initiation factor Spo0A C-terminal domain-containing protein [Candidatus Coprovivens excrementavium]
MKNNMNTLVVCSKEESNKLKQEIAVLTTEITIKYTADNYKDALQIINNSDDLDAILIDGTMPGENILNLLTNYKNEILLSRTIIIDNIKLDCYNLSASNYQIFNVIPKNYKINELIISLKEIKNKQEKYNFHKISIYDKVAEILKKLGIAPDKNGFHYLRKAIYECYLEPSLLTSITKEIYPMLAASFSKKESCIERSIRSAIETGWDRGNYEYSNELFSNCVDYYKTKPTNGEFIAIIVDKIMMEEGRTIY